MLSDVIEQESFFRLAADRVFFFGLYDPSETGEYGQLAEHNYIFETVANTMLDGVESNITGYDWDVEIVQYIGLTGPRVFAEANNAVLTQDEDNRVLVTTLATVSNSFNWLNHDDRTQVDPNYAALIVYAAANSMLSDSVVGGSVQEIFQYFDLDDLVSTGSTDYGRGPSHSVIKDHVSFKITDGPDCPEKEFSPFVGSSGDTSYGNIDETKPTLVRSTLQLTYPRVSPTLTLTLKNPEFGNTDTITFARVDRTTRGGERKIYGDNTLSKSQVFRLDIANLAECKVPIDDIVTFLNSSLGKEIGLRDWEGRNWKGHIVVPETDIRKEASGTSVTITFDGELV